MLMNSGFNIYWDSLRKSSSDFLGLMTPLFFSFHLNEALCFSAAWKHMKYVNNPGYGKKGCKSSTLSEVMRDCILYIVTSIIPLEMNYPHFSSANCGESRNLNLKTSSKLLISHLFLPMNKGLGHLSLTIPNDFQI